MVFKTGVSAKEARLVKLLEDHDSCMVLEPAQVATRTTLSLGLTTACDAATLTAGSSRGETLTTAVAEDEAPAAFDANTVNDRLVDVVMAVKFRESVDPLVLENEGQAAPNSGDSWVHCQTNDKQLKQLGSSRSALVEASRVRRSRLPTFRKDPPMIDARTPLMPTLMVAVAEEDTVKFENFRVVVTFTEYTVALARV
jgi:hypothetical protein